MISVILPQLVYSLQFINGEFFLILEFLIVRGNLQKMWIIAKSVRSCNERVLDKKWGKWRTDE